MDAYQRSRAALARRLHDGVSQSLTSVGVALDLLRLDYGHVDGLSERTSQIQGRLQDAFDETQALSYALAPDRLSREGLADALRRLDGTDVKMESVPELSAKKIAALYIAAELLSTSETKLSVVLFSGGMRVTGAAVNGALTIAERIASEAGFNVTRGKDIIEFLMVPNDAV